MSDTKSRNLLVPLVVLALGLVAAWWWWGRDDPMEPRPTAAESGADAGDRSKRAGGFALDKSDPKLGHLPWQRPAASISGTITATGAGPLAGAQVCVWLEHDDLPAELGREPRCTTSAADGRYRLGDLPPLRFELHASAPEHVPARFSEGDGRWGVSLVPGQERKGVDVALDPGGVQVQGIIKDIAGGVVEGALVSGGGNRWGWGNRSGRSVVHTDAEGRFSLWTAAGVVWLDATAEGYARSSREGTAPGYTFEIFLTPESVVIGRVVMADTKAPVADAIVEVSNERAVSDADGRFRIERLSPGSYHPSATSELAYGKSAASVHVGLSETSDEVVIELHPAAYVEGMVVKGDEKGEPCEQSSVGLSHTTDTTRRHHGRSDHGVVKILGVRPGTYRVEAYCEGHVTGVDYDEVVVATAPVTGLTWPVQPGVEIRGVVVEASGTPLAKVNVAGAAITEGRAGTNAYASDESDQDGTFVLTGVAPGRYRLTASAEGVVENKEPLEIEVGEGGVDGVKLTVTRGGTVEGHVVDEHGEPLAGITVTVNESWGSRATTADDGSFRIEGVEPGDHRITARQDWGNELRAPGQSDDAVPGEQVAVVDGEVATVEIVVEGKQGEIRGRVVDATGGPVSDAFIDEQRESDSAAAAEGRNRQQVRWGSWGQEPTLTDQDGRFTLTGLSDGKYTLRAYRKGGGEAIVEHVELGSTDVQLAIADTGSLTGKVVFTAGGAPDEFSVTMQEQAQSIWKRDRFYRTDGAFTFDELVAGEYTVTVTSNAGDATADVTVKAGEETTGVELELTPRITLHGRVVELTSGEPVPGIRVSVGPRKGGTSFSFSARGDVPFITDDAGRFTLENATAGKVRVTLMPRDWGSEDYGWSSLNATIPTDVESYELPDIRIVKNRKKRADKDGDLGFKLAEKPPEIDFEEFPLKVAFVRPGGPAAAAGLKAGDEITSVDGHAVTGDDRYLYHSLVNVTPGTSIELGLAEGSPVTLVAGAPP